MAALSGPGVINVADLRRLAKARLPRVVFDYIDGGAEDEVTMRENRRAFEEVTFRPRGAVVTPACDLATTVLGTRLAMPFALAPVGSTRLFWPRGEVHAARAAAAAGTAYAISTLVGTPIEEIRG
ncbi:MAG: alpha-hydroxy-acid oxidizing protein, partial [Chloroflexi bacterium]|nr:alpha-hydroxy-acid oxidizing protein [Chloroflexota bacterium]